MKLNITDAALDGVFAALGHPHRRALLERMAADGEVRVTDLASEFDVSLNQVSKHLKILERAGLVRRRRAGREHFLSADLRRVMQARTWIDAYAAFWSDSMRGLEAYLDRSTPTNPSTPNEGGTP